jgi:hypothetical protein
MSNDQAAVGEPPVRPVVSRLFELMRSATGLPSADERLLEDLAARLSVFDEAPPGTPVPSTSTPPDKREPGPD